MRALKPAHPGIVRHGVLPARYPNSRKTLQDRYGVLGHSQVEFSCRRGWNVMVRIWLKITFAGDAIMQTLEGVEIPPDGQPRRMESIPSADKDIRWVEKSPLKLYQLKQIIEAGLDFAEDLVVEKAEDLQKNALKSLYPTFKRLRAYYRQLAADAAGSSQGETGAIEAEYRRRLRDEILYARVKATMDLIALETITTPVQKLKWLLHRNGKSKEVNAVLNLHDGSLIPMVWCDVCSGQIVDRQVLNKSNCSICNINVCDEHVMYCEPCGDFVCRDHHFQRLDH